MSMVNIASIEFSPVGRIYDFENTLDNVCIGDQVVVETDRGFSLAKVVKLRLAPNSDFEERTLKPLLRKASEKDLKSSSKTEPEYAEKLTREKIKKLNLKMKVLKVETQFGGNKVLIYFSAPGRVDFRELVKQLAAGLKSRVELKQVGARDEAKLLGGMGICGREFCCSTFLREFLPVSIKMAKVQNLALNPTKVSGGCGRLLCCLTYENETYIELRKNIPANGSRVRVLETNQFGRVIKHDILNQKISIEFEQGTIETIKIDQVEVVEKASKQRTEDEAKDDDWGDDIDLEALESND